LVPEKEITQNENRKRKIPESTSEFVQIKVGKFEVMNNSPYTKELV